jgi:hypothetical protein
VAHLVGDDVVEGAFGLHLLQVIGVEGHDALGRQQRGGTRALRTDVGGARLAEDLARAVDGPALRLDEDVVDDVVADAYRR